MMKNNGQDRKMTQKKVICLTLSSAMVLGLTGCGQETVQAQTEEQAEEEQEQVLNNVLNAQVSPSHSSGAGKEETVYVLADANGSVDQVIVSDWLKNGDGGQSLADSSDLKDIQNVKGYEAFEQDQDGNIIWQAQGSDIYYRGSTDKEVPVEVKVSYQLDGKDISAAELAGKSGRVTIRMDYENKETRKVEIGGKEQEIKIPFAMISGMILPQDTFSNIEVTNARLLSEGNNSIVVGLAFPGLRESIDADALKEKLEDTEENEDLKELEIPEYIEISADTDCFELGMTMTVAMSDVLSDIELTDSLDLSDLNDSMEELRDATEQLKDGTVELKDGSGKLKDGTVELVSGTEELWDGAAELKDGSSRLKDGTAQLKDGALQLKDGASQLKDGTQELYDKSGLLGNGAAALYDGTTALQDGARKLTDGTGALKEGGNKLAAGTGSLVAGAESLNNGALLVQGGVNQVAAQMGMLQAKIGTPVGSSAEFDAANPSTLLQLSCLLNESLKSASSQDGLAEPFYNALLSSLQQQKSQAQENLNNSSANLAAAQERVKSAQAELIAASQGSMQEFETVTGTHEEESYVDVTVEAPVYTTTRTVTEGSAGDEGEEGETSGEGSTVVESTEVETQSVTGTGVVTKEVVDTDTIQVQSVDVENLQQKAGAYQSAVEEAAACQADVDAWSMQVAALEEQIAQADTYADQIAQAQTALMQKWGPAITYAAYMDNYLKEISGALNSQESTAGMTALVKGAGDLVGGTQSALAGAKELNSGASELKNGINSLNSGADELAKGAGTLKAGAGELKNGTGQLIDGTAKLNEGAGTLKDGAGTLSDGAVTLDDGMGTLDDGIGTLQDGACTLKDGAVTLDDGMGTLDDGALELLNGMFEFDEEGISKLTDLFGDDVQDVVDRLKAVADAGKEYNTFTRLPENVDGSVKFIIKTEGVEQQ